MRLFIFYIQILCICVTSVLAIEFVYTIKGNMTLTLWVIGTNILSSIFMFAKAIKGRRIVL